jgi:GAF domain-containing protein
VQTEHRLCPAAAAGTPVPDPVCIPLVYQREPVGQLLLAQRAGSASLSPADRRLLGDLARQAGVAAHAVQLSAREEERHRAWLSSRRSLIGAFRAPRRRACPPWSAHVDKVAVLAYVCLWEAQTNLGAEKDGRRGGML